MQIDESNSSKLTVREGIHDADYRAVIAGKLVFIAGIPASCKSMVYAYFARKGIHIRTQTAHYEGVLGITVCLRDRPMVEKTQTEHILTAQLPLPRDTSARLPDAGEICRSVRNDAPITPPDTDDGL